MPSFPFSQALTANQLGFDPLTSWQFRQIPLAYPRGAYCRLIINATGVSARLTLYSGSQTIQQRAPIGGGGTAGTLPNPLNNQVIEWIGAPGDFIVTAIDEVSGLTPTVNGIFYVDPVPGG